MTDRTYAERVRESADLSGTVLPGDYLGDQDEALRVLATMIPPVVTSDAATTISAANVSPDIFLDALAVQVCRAYMLAAAVGGDLDAAIDAALTRLTMATLPPKGL